MPERSCDSRLPGNNAPVTAVVAVTAQDKGYTLLQEQPPYHSVLMTTHQVIYALNTPGRGQNLLG
ncbi:hypothetical protein [Dickeya zeae]|uniref:hypothetical protein n=1 Tax=Dickeya zeae TaxID=204042 RepID=UPI001267E93E|nr:hypothetical protein [Dickeya zeae]UJR55221.1 hypothetical protein J417_14900 [Dickeya zeae MS1]